MPAYISDGYVTEGYVVSPKTTNDETPLFEPLEFQYRVATRLEVIRHDGENERIARKVDDPETPIKLEMSACKFVADHTVSWELKGREGAEIAINADSISRLQPYLFNRMYAIVRNTAVSDPKPAAPPALSDDEQKKT